MMVCVPQSWHWAPVTRAITTRLSARANAMSASTTEGTWQMSHQWPVRVSMTCASRLIVVVAMSRSPRLRSHRSGADYGNSSPLVWHLSWTVAYRHPVVPCRVSVCVEDHRSALFAAVGRDSARLFVGWPVVALRWKRRCPEFQSQGISHVVTLPRARLVCHASMSSKFHAGRPPTVQRGGGKARLRWRH